MRNETVYPSRSDERQWLKYDGVNLRIAVYGPKGDGRGKNAFGGGGYDMHRVRFIKGKNMSRESRNPSGMPKT
jgi:hypothetical protein